MDQQWQFDEDEQQQWRWTRVGDHAAHRKSSNAFATPVDCFMDAVRHAVRRRREASENGTVQAH